MIARDKECLVIEQSYPYERARTYHSLSLSLKDAAAIQNNFKQPNEAVLKIEQKTSLKNHSAKRFKSTQSEIMLDKNHVDKKNSANIRFTQ